MCEKQGVRTVFCLDCDEKASLYCLQDVVSYKLSVMPTAMFA